MATFRLNTFHWHLVDSQGWRLQLKTTAGLENQYTNTPGFYTAKDIKEVVDYAKKLHISVIPEIDFPGHSHGLLKYFPQYACKTPVEKTGEICLGNPAVKTMVKNILQEVMELFKGHVGVYLEVANEVVAFVAEHAILKYNIHN
jgi:hexosaminidase